MATSLPTMLSGHCREPSPDRDPRRGRVFCLGLNKTGTSSFHEAMIILGLESLHWGGPPTRRTVEQALDAGRPLLESLDPRFDAFSDIEPIYRNFDLVDQQYPGSRFVLTVRPVADWIDSRCRHVERNRRRRAAGDYDGTFLDIDEPAWRSEWHDHVDSVRAYFASRPDFLEIDLTSGSTWKPLTRFLSLPEPTVAFPWANRHRTHSPNDHPG